MASTLRDQYELCGKNLQLYPGAYVQPPGRPKRRSKTHRRKKSALELGSFKVAKIARKKTRRSKLANAGRPKPLRMPLKNGSYANDPALSKKQRNPKKCTLCDQEGHNRTTCDNPSIEILLTSLGVLRPELIQSEADELVAQLEEQSFDRHVCLVCEESTFGGPKFITCVNATCRQKIHLMCTSEQIQSRKKLQALFVCSSCTNPRRKK